MSLQIQKAQRSKVKLKMGISGPSGSGKTLSALKLASGITEWKKICVLDTENNSASLYSHLGEFNVIPMESPYSPERFIEAIGLCEQSGMEVLIIDSASAEWIGAGGCLEIHSKMAGNSFVNWGKVGPRHASFIDAILRSKLHIISCLRSKQEYSLDKDSGGKSVVVKMGMAEQSRDGFSYEVSLNFTLEMNHYATADKDRTGLFSDKPSFLITPETGKQLLKWCQEGVDSLEENKKSRGKDYLAELKAELRKRGAKTQAEALKIMNSVWYGEPYKAVDVRQEEAQSLLLLLNS